MIKFWEKKQRLVTKEADQVEQENVMLDRYTPSYQEGLSTEQVQMRHEQKLTNQTVDSSFKSVRDIVRDNTFTYFNLIFVIFSILLMLVNSFENLTFLPVVIINTLIGIHQEIRSKKIIDNLTMLNSPHTRVIRDNKEHVVPTEDLVLDDVVIFSAGDQITADAYIIEGSIQVNESLLTGESDEVKKDIGDELMSGSFVVNGQCYARLDKVGEDSYISKLTLEAKAMGNEESSEMIKQVNGIVKWVGVLIIPIGFLLFGQSFYLNNHDFKRSTVSTLAALIGMIPEGIYLLTTVTLAMSAIRLASKKVLLHNMKSIETLARVNILCVDKTGTITEDKMAVNQLVIIDETENSVYSEQALLDIIADFCHNLSPDNETMIAMQNYFTKKAYRTATSQVAFSSVNKYSSVSFESETYLLGAPEMILRESYANHQEEVQAYAKKGYRVLVFAKYEGNILEEEPLIDRPAVALAYILLANPIRKEALSTFHYFNQQDVAIKVFSGDNPFTVTHVAQEAGIPNADHFVDAATLTSDDLIKEALKQNTVFGRVTPEQKKRFVELLKLENNTVAMVGDGVNDILAMKEADCSIAMATGNEATIQSAQVILLESEFSKMPEVVAEGRQVVNNIERSASLFLVKNIFSFLMALFSVAFSITYPLQPAQITLISLFTIGIPSFLLALESNVKRIQGSFLANVMSKAIAGGVTDTLIVASLVVCGRILDLNTNDIATTATLLLVAVGFMVLYKISSPMNHYRRNILVSCLIGMIIALTFLSKLFLITYISRTSLLLLVILFFSAESIFRVLSLVSEKIHAYCTSDNQLTRTINRIKEFSQQLLDFL